MKLKKIYKNDTAPQILILFILFHDLEHQIILLYAFHHNYTHFLHYVGNILKGVIFVDLFELHSQ